MKGGVILFRGSGAVVRRYVEADRSRADEYYLGADHAVAEYVVIDATGEVTTTHSLTADEYEAWVDWVNLDMGVPRQPGDGRRCSRRWSSTPPSPCLSRRPCIRRPLALDAAQQDAPDWLVWSASGE